MKICMIVPDPDVKGGIASVVNGYRTFDFGQQCEISYVESYRDGSRLQKLFKAVKGYGRFWKLLKKNTPDIVHIHSSFGPSFYRKLPFIYMAAGRKLPIVNHIHGAEFDQFYTNASSAKRKRIQRAYNKCSCLVALSDEWRERLLQIVPESKIAVIENYCRIPEITENEKQRKILFLGEIGERKGCHDIPVIYRRAAERTELAPLFMAGDGVPSEVEKVKALFEKEQVSETVFFPGWVRGKEKETLLRECGIFLFPSYNEGMPMAVLEAMAYGMAVVSTTAGGIPKLIESGVNGYLCAPGDTEALAGRLAELLQDEKKRNALGGAARRKAMERFSLESHMEKLTALYHRVMAEEKAGEGQC